MSFDFRIIKLADGTDVIDRTLKTPMCALTPMAQLEYSEVANSLFIADREARKQARMQKKESFSEKLHRVLSFR